MPNELRDRLNQTVDFRLNYIGVGTRLQFLLPVRFTRRALKEKNWRVPGMARIRRHNFESIDLRQPGSVCIDDLSGCSYCFGLDQRES